MGKSFTIGKMMTFTANPGSRIGVNQPSNQEYTAFVGHHHLASGSLADVGLKAKERVDGGEQDLITIFRNETGDVIDLDYRGTVDEFLARLPRQNDDDASASAEPTHSGPSVLALSDTAEPTRSGRSGQALTGPAEPTRPGPSEQALSGLAGPTPSDPAKSTRSGPDRPTRSGPGRPRLGVVSREVTLLPRHWEWLNAQPGGASATLRKLVEKARRDGYEAERARRLRDGAYRFMSFMAGDFPHFEEASRALFAKQYERLDTLIEKWPRDVREHLQRLVRNVRRAEAEADLASRNDLP